MSITFEVIAKLIGMGALCGVLWLLLLRERREVVTTLPSGQMKRFTDAGRRAVTDGNLYAALSLALMLPDICASLEDPGPSKSRARYIRWCTQWVEPKFTRPHLIPGEPPLVFLSAEDCYNVRNSLIHSGSSEVEPSKIKRLHKVEFFDASTGSHMNFFEEVLQLKADLFSETLFSAVDEWDAASVGNATVQAEKAKLLVIRAAGDTILGGSLVIG